MTGRTSRSGWRVLTLVAAPVVVAVVLLAAAVLSDAVTVPGSTFAIQDCTTAELASVQRGTATTTTHGATDVAITAVAPERSFVLASVRSASADPGDSLVRVELAATDRVTITRSTDAASPPAVDVTWTVVEYSCGVNVQRGTSSGDGSSSTHDVVISPVDPSRSFALVTSTPQQSSPSVGLGDSWSPSLPDERTLRLRNAAPAAAGSTVAWQVVEMAATAGSVQQVAGVVPDGAATADLALTTAVDPGTTLVLASPRPGAGVGSLADATVRAEIAGSSTLRLSRQTSGGIVRVEAFVVSFTDGTTVQSGQLELGPGEASDTATITAVDASRTAVLSTTSIAGGQSWGSTDSTGLVVGEATATFELAAADSVVVKRAATTSTARFTYQVVGWGGPTWWDTSYARRQPLRVDTTTAAAPAGYTVPVTIDHAALVSSGDALVSGDDVRVLHFDGTAWTELDRVLAEGSAWDDAATTIEFRTVDPIAAGGSDGSYWLYLGNTAAGAPPADPRAVYALDDDFEDGTLAQFGQAGPGRWYVADPWSWRVSLTVPAGSVEDDLTDFPVLVSFASASLADHAQPDGSDLRFTAADGTTRLAHELVAFDPGSGAVEAWVEVPELAAGTDTELFLYAGSANAPAQQDVRGTWDNGYVGVWHLADDPSGTLPHAGDSSPEGRDGVAAGAMTTADRLGAQVGEGLDLDGTDDLVEVGAVAVEGAGLTVSAWVRADTTTGDPVLVGRGATSGPTSSWALALADSGSGTADVALELDLGGTPTTIAGTGVATGSWHHLAGVTDGATASVFVDGSRVAGAPVDGLLAETSGHEAALGAHPSATRHLDGRLDEVRVSDVSRSESWLAAEHATTADPAAFVVVGAPETGTWFAQGAWASRTPLTVRAGTVGSDLVDFPLLVDTTVTGLTDALASGADLVVTAADGTTRLDHELEAVDPGTGAVRLWVRVPTLSSATDTTLFLYWGNASAEDWQDPVGVWGEDARAVLHLGETPDG